MDLFHRKIFDVCILDLWPGDLGLFQVCRIVAASAVTDGVLAGIGHDHELMRKTAADASRISLHGTKTETAAGKDPLIRLEHLPVTFFRPGLVHIETVGILHAEFPAAHHTEPRPNLVTEFRLNLIEVPGKLTVGFNVVSNQIGDHFLMCRAEAALPVMAIPESKQFFSVMNPATGLLPEFGGLNHRQKKLLGPRTVHLLPHDLFKLSDDAVAQGKVGVYPAGQFSHQTRPDHQLVADQFRI